MLAIFLLMVVAILFVEQGQRRIPIQFAKRVRGRRVMGGNATYIPLKVNTAGVIPMIFATSVLTFPALLVTFIPLRERCCDAIAQLGRSQPGALSRAAWSYIFLLFFLVIFFTYFYTAIQFDPANQADTIQRQGGFIPGVRPGTATEHAPRAHPEPHHPSGGPLPRPSPCCRRWSPWSGTSRSASVASRPHRGRGRSRDDEADREPADDAELRRLPDLIGRRLLRPASG